MRKWVIAVCVVLASSAWSGQVQAQVETFDYTVEEGDTCESIAEEFYGHLGGCDLIEKYNPGGGSGPKISPGNVLQLPTSVAKAEAMVDRKHGSVRAREPDRSWHNANVGEELFRTWRVNTLEEARAELAFRDKSKLKMRQNTLIIIYGGSREKIRRKRSHARLEKGTLRSRLGELSGDEGLDLDTPSASAKLNKGNSLVDVEENGTTRVANHGGKPVDVSGRGSAAKKTVTVKAGMGTKVEKGKPPTPPKKLPPAPAWKPGPRNTLSLGGERSAVTAEWEPVDEAAEYFVEVAADKGGIEVMKSAYVPSDVTRLRVENLPPGTYYATVSSIDADKFEGIPSKRLRLRVLPVNYDAAARLDDGESPRFVLGSRLSAPGETKCAVEDEKPAGSVRMTAPGAFELHCIGPDGEAAEPRSFTVASPEVEVGGPGFRDGRVEVALGQFALVDLSFDPIAPSDLNVVVRGEGMAESVEATPTPVTRKRWRVKVAPGGEKPGEATLRVRSGESQTLKEIPIRIRPGATAEKKMRGGDGSSESQRSLRVGFREIGRAHV